MTKIRVTFTFKGSRISESIFAFELKFGYYEKATKFENNVSLKI